MLARRWGALAWGLVACVVLFVAGATKAQEPAPAPPPERAVQDGPAPIAGVAPPAESPADAGEPGSELTVYVITFSPGDHPFYKFGHNAIWIHDAKARDPRRRDMVYNWGTFSFGDPALIPKFVLGRFMYWLSIAGIDSTKRAYQRENRSIDAQELDLSPAQRLELKRRVDENAKNENRYYKYDYYRDNCSTRVRDMIDGVIDGRLHAAMEGPGRLTYRQHTTRLTEDFPAVSVALSFAMGSLIDQPTSLWSEAFIPMELQTSMRKVTLVDESGKERPLVKGERTILTANRPPPSTEPPSWTMYGLFAGLGLGGALFGLARLAKGGKKAARVTLGALLAALGLVFGFFGCFFLFVWGFTDHGVGYHNENILLSVPWALVLAGTGLRAAFGRARSIHFAAKLVLAAAASTALCLVLKVLPWFDQDNWLFLAFFLPMWGGAAAGLRELAAATPLVATTAAKKAAPKAEAKKAQPKKAEEAAPAKKAEEAAPAKKAEPEAEADGTSEDV